MSRKERGIFSVVKGSLRQKMCDAREKAAQKISFMGTIGKAEMILI